MSGLKEKKEKKPNLFKDPFKLVKNLRGRSKGVKAAEDPQQPPTEQKSPLLTKNLSSDAMPMQDTRINRHHGASPPRHGEVEMRSGIEPPQLVIKMSNGKTVDHPDAFKTHGTVEYGTSPPSTSPWSPSSSGYPAAPFPRQADRRPGYGAPSHPSPWTDYEHQDVRRPVESPQQTATYDGLLREAQTLRRDLEKEYGLNRGSKEEIAQKINFTKLQIADVQKNKPSAEMYDEIIVSLSQELTDLEKKVREIEARMYPLDRAISDLKDVEDFIEDRELDSDGAAMLFEEIMKKMFDDINVSGHVLSGEAVSAGHLPKSVLDEMKGKMLTGAFHKADPGASGSEQEGGDWVAFGSDYDTREKLTSTDGQESNYRKRRNRANFQRASRKLSSITEFTHSRMKNPARTEAFKFHAFDRADAFRHVEYYPADDIGKQGISMMSSAMSIASDTKSQEEVVLQQVGTEMWTEFDKGRGATPPPSDAPSMKSSKSVADVQALDQYPGLSSEVIPAEKDDQNKDHVPVQSIESKPSVDSAVNNTTLSTVGSEGKPPLMIRFVQTADTQTRPPKGVASQIEDDEQGDAKQSAKKESEEVEMKSDEQEKGGLAQQLANAQLKKATDKPQQPMPSAPDMESADMALLAASILGQAAPGEKAEGGVKLDLNVEEAPAPPKKPATKPPPPPPKKGAPPPPPPPKKKGGPPPPPGKKKPGAKGGPPPPPGGRAKGNDGLQRAPEVIAMFQEMRKALLGNAAKGSGGPKKIGGGGAADPAALMQELAKNSKYAAQVQADIENYGSLIEDLIKEISGFVAEDMKDIVEFVKRVDAFLDELADETAVLKQFDWPARYYTMLEAKGLYEELEKMKKTFKPWQRTAKNGSEELKVIQKFMDKSKNRVDVILRTKDADEKKFRENKIPWNAKIYTEVKIASLSALVVYMEICMEEVEAIMNAAPAEASPKRSKALEKSMTLLTGAINFAFKAHQFAGGFTEACNTMFAKIASKTRDLKSEVAGAAS